MIQLKSLISKDNVENRGTRVNMNKIKVIINGDGQNLMQKVVRGPSVVDVMVATQYSVLFVRSGYTRSVVV